MTCDEYVVNQLWKTEMEIGSLKRQVEELRAEQEKFLKLKETIKKYGRISLHSYSDSKYINIKAIDNSKYDRFEKEDFDFLVSIVDFENDFEENPEGAEDDD